MEIKDRVELPIPNGYIKGPTVAPQELPSVGKEVLPHLMYGAPQMGDVYLCTQNGLSNDSPSDPVKLASAVQSPKESYMQQDLSLRATIHRDPRPTSLAFPLFSLCHSP